MTARPLAGLRVLDLSRVFAGPVAGRILSDLGADVVKVEPPDEDLSRVFGLRSGGMTAYFMQQNAGKRNVCVDLNHPEGPSIVAELAAVADVVIENFRPRVLASFGLDWPALSGRNPRLVMVSITGFGQNGPESERAAFASIAHAEMGLIARGPELGVGGLHDLTFSAADVLSGLHAVIGLLAALRSRDITGAGQHLDLAMLDAVGFSDDAVVYNLDGIPATGLNGEVWDAVGGPICLAGGFKWVWHQLHDVIGVADPSPLDADVATKIRLRRETTSALFRSMPDRSTLIAMLEKAKLAWGNVRHGADVFESPTLQARNSVVTIDDRNGGTRPIFQSPYRYSDMASGVTGPARHLGEDNVSVLTEWLGLATGDGRLQSGALRTRLPK